MSRPIVNGDIQEDGNKKEKLKAIWHHRLIGLWEENPINLVAGEK